MTNKITEHFTWSEFEFSQAAIRKGIDNTIPQELRPNIFELCVKYLEPIRKEWGSGLRITSGYRCYRLNKATGGSKKSEHLKATAVDFIPAKGKLSDLFRLIISMNLDFNQLIWEGNWIHLGIGGYKNEILRAEFMPNKTIYHTLTLGDIKEL